MPHSKYSEGVTSSRLPHDEALFLIAMAIPMSVAGATT
jgi:hypothetical protein